MTGDAPGVPVGDLVLAQGGQEAGRAPAFAVGAGAEFLPEAPDGRQAELRSASAAAWRRLVMGRDPG